MISNWELGASLVRRRLSGLGGSLCVYKRDAAHYARWVGEVRQDQVGIHDSQSENRALSLPSRDDISTRPNLLSPRLSNR